MNFAVGDLVTRNSYNNDTLFKIVKIDNNIAYLKGVNDRLYADSDILDLKKEDFKDEFNPSATRDMDRNEYFYIPGTILHIDGDEEYLDKCLTFYKENKVHAVGKRINEEEIYKQLPKLLKDYKPDVLVITGHDAYFKNSSDKESISNYKNSKNFINAVRIARVYEPSHDKLVIIAGACQSNYEKLIKAGANFASSPKRVNIHALDPAIIATSVALTRSDKQIDLISIIEKTKTNQKASGE